MQVWSEDPEQVQRVHLHQSRRPEYWITIECPRFAERTLAALALQDPDSSSATSRATIIFDCLSLYTTNILLAITDGGKKLENKQGHEHEEKTLLEIQQLIQAMESIPQFDFIVVSNEVGWGIVPETALGRSFRDVLGLANQRMAAAANEAYLVCSGLKIKLK